MSANIDFSSSAAQPAAAAGPSSGATASKAKPVIILPYDILYSLQGRRVTVLLTVRQEELDGLLRTVDSDRGDLYLEDVVHYDWLAEGESAPAGAAGGSAVSVKGGGSRREVRRCASAMVNSRFIDIITPTVFEEEHKQ